MPICVVFVGTEPPDRNWLLEHATPSIVRREYVRAALLWLKRNNPLYATSVSGMKMGKLSVPTTSPVSWRQEPRSL